MPVSTISLKVMEVGQFGRLIIVDSIASPNIVFVSAGSVRAFCTFAEPVFNVSRLE